MYFPRHFASFQKLFKINTFSSTFQTIASPSKKITDSGVVLSSESHLDMLNTCAKLY